MATSMTRVIASRELVRMRDGEEVVVRVELGEPVQDVETTGGNDWRCPFRIGDGKVRNLYGADAMAALLFAVRFMLDDAGGLRGVAWLGKGGSGLPRVEWEETIDG